MKSKKSQPRTLKSGFTLVELSFAIAFMSVLLIVIATLISYIVASYQKGLTIKAVNSVGKAITEDITGSISDSYSVNLCNDAASCSPPSTVFKSNNSGGHQASGRFCTGTYSYAWYTGYSNADARPYRLLKIQDPTRSICANKNMPNASSGEELLSASEQQLILYELKIDSIAQESISNAAFYSGSFTLGTTTGVNLNADTQCKVDGSTLTLSSDFSYCAINKFNFAARTAGG